MTPYARSYQPGASELGVLSIGPDCVAKFASGLLARNRLVSRMPALPLPI